MELEEAIKTLKIIVKKSDQPFKFAIETVLKELENRIPKKEIEDRIEELKISRKFAIKCNNMIEANNILTEIVILQQLLKKKK